MKVKQNKQKKKKRRQPNVHDTEVQVLLSSGICIKYFILN